MRRWILIGAILLAFVVATHLLGRPILHVDVELKTDVKVERRD